MLQCERRDSLRRHANCSSCSNSINNQCCRFTIEILQRKFFVFCPGCYTECCFRWCCRCCFLGDEEEGRVQSTSTRNLMRSQKRFSAMESIILLTWFGIVIRMSWVVAIINGRTASVVLVDQYTGERSSEERNRRDTCFALSKCDCDFATT